MFVFNGLLGSSGYFFIFGDGGVWGEVNMVALIVGDGFWAGGVGWGQVVDLVGKIFWWGL